MKVVVTGGKGFIGSHTVDMLIEKGHQVVVIDNKLNSSFHNEKAKYFKEDILNKQELTEIFHSFMPDAVIHLAAQVDVQQSILHPDKDIEINLKGTINVLELCKRFGSKIIFASSAAVYGVPNQLPIREDHETKPLSIYGLSKLSAERYIQLYHEIYGLEYCIFRYANVYGPRQDSTGEGGVVSIFVDQLVNNQIPIIYGEGNQTRDFVFVKDVARANVQALTNGSNRIFNVCNTKETSVNELLFHLAKLLVKDISPVYKEAKKGDIDRSILDSGNIINNLNWGWETDLITGLQETIDFFQLKNLQKKV